MTSASSRWRGFAFAGLLALSFTGTSAALDGAQAMPIATAIAQSAPAAEAAGVTAIQYYPYYRRPYYRRYGRAGVYRCGPAGVKTHLQRQACGTRLPSRRYY